MATNGPVYQYAGVCPMNLRIARVTPRNTKHPRMIVNSSWSGYRYPIVKTAPVPTKKTAPVMMMVSGFRLPWFQRRSLFPPSPHLPRIQ